jgi:translation initiation factor 1
MTKNKGNLLEVGKSRVMELSYSTDPNWCAKCKHLPCQCKGKTTALPTKGGMVKMRREVRRGKPVIVLFELGIGEAQSKELLKEIQRTCGAGGAYKDGTIEIQGDHRERMEQMLQQRGFKVKRAGG